MSRLTKIYAVCIDMWKMLELFPRPAYENKVCVDTSTCMGSKIKDQGPVVQN